MIPGKREIEYWERTCAWCGTRTVIYFPEPARGAAWECKACHRYAYLNEKHQRKYG